ncbi:hypothetical protein SRM_p61031 (plasmid) [Salinibacter ruber M8]|uniref:Uncharacterized protein n=1 Tax=Salinibacter ruber (strain M8) TaxID=761659 RepID=D5H4E7_SALRM|nr:hypothetical protein SRM_p61031 [Salinibacter ruber M8]
MPYDRFRKLSSAEEKVYVPVTVYRAQKNLAPVDIFEAFVGDQPWCPKILIGA